MELHSLKQLVGYITLRCDWFVEYVETQLSNIYVCFFAGMSCNGRQVGLLKMWDGRYQRKLKTVDSIKLCYNSRGYVERVDRI